MKNIGWYIRDGHLDFLTRLSLNLSNRGIQISNFYVCHTTSEKELIQKEYNVHPWVLADYIRSRGKNFNISKVEISTLEEKFDFISLRKLLWAEMYEKKYSEEKLIFHLIAHIEFWEKFLVENKIEGIVSERSSILSTSVLWILCKKYNIKFLDFINVGVDGRVLFTSAWDGSIDCFQEKFENIKVDEKSDVYLKAVQYLEKMRTRPEKPEYIFRNLYTGKKTKGNRLYHSLPSIKKISILPKYLNSFLAKETYYIGQSIIERIIDTIVHETRILLHKFINVFEKNVSALNEKYFLFPLHVNYEWSAYQYMGLNYPNYINVLEEIASCLPLGYKLYVKEHTSGFPDRSYAIYNRIKKIRNVRLISGNENTFQLVKKSEGIITLGGTLGWEAFLMGKPVVILNEPWYRFLPGIYKSKSSEDLVSLLQNIRNLPLANQDDQVKAIYCLLMLSFEAIRYPVVDLISTENVNKYAEVFQHWLNGSNNWIDLISHKN